MNFMQTQSQTQVQRLSQQQLQNVQLLQMSSIELASFVQELALSNPMVEPDDIFLPAESRDEELLAKYRWLDENDRQNRYYQHIEYDELDPLTLASNNGGLEETLFHFLSRQLQTIPIKERERQIAQMIASCLDEDGYLRIPLTELSQSMGIPEPEMASALAVLQSLEPAGVGATNLPECLALQLIRCKETGPVLEIVQHHLEELAKHHYHSIAAKLNISAEEVQRAVLVIRELNPKPGEIFQQSELSLYILPDIFIEEIDGRFVPYLRNGESPSFHINSYYRELLSRTEDREVREYLLAQLNQAEGVLWAIGQRKNTMLRCAQIIAERQSNFFRNGPQALASLTMVEVAAQMEVHESTISRAVRGKYIQCTRGIYPMHYFFSRAAVAEEGDSIMGGTAAKALLQQLICSEDKHHPLSDQQLSKAMAERDCPISRRTVAKYRQELEIPSAFARRV